MTAFNCLITYNHYQSNKRWQLRLLILATKSWCLVTNQATASKHLFKAVRSIKGQGMSSRWPPGSCTGKQAKRRWFLTRLFLHWQQLSSFQNNRGTSVKGQSQILLIICQCNPSRLSLFSSNSALHPPTRMKRALLSSQQLLHKKTHARQA